MKLSLDSTKVSALLAKAHSGSELQTIPAAAADQRHPLHTVYGGAHLFKPDLSAKFSRLAQESLQHYAPSVEHWRDLLGFQKIPLPEAGVRADLERPAGLSAAALQHFGNIFFLAWVRMRHKLQLEAVEDVRLDFEDGLGSCSDQKEDEIAIAAARELATAIAQNSAPPFVGIRIRALHGKTAVRAARTLDLFVTELVGRVKKFPANFSVALPKVKDPREASALRELIAELEGRLGIQGQSIKIELLAETAELLCGTHGAAALGQAIVNCAGRCRAVHFGLFDFTSSLGVASHAQYLKHPYCDFARFLILGQTALYGVRAVDSITHLIPVAPLRAKDGQALGQKEQEFNLFSVQRAWRLHFENIANALKLGFYQGWDLHPAQLPVRYFASYLFFLEGLSDATKRLKLFLEQRKGATLSGNTFDDMATVRGLANFIFGGINCGAFSSTEAAQLGVAIEELRAALRV